ncbi:MAG: hypothetical protein IJJ23_07070 [Clostridia bacterium]|nr:hypothetical protein [Clostridia bacterium]
MKKLLSVLNIIAHSLIFVIVVVYFIAITFRLDPSGKVVVTGSNSLRYFTVLSNLFQGLASLIIALSAVLGLKKSRWLSALQWAAATSVGLTFFTVLIFLGPPIHYQGMYDGSNLWFHLLIPIAAMLLFILSRDDKPLPLSWIGWSLAPMAVYGVFYTVNIAVNGFFSHGARNDFYNFLRGSWKNAPASGLIMLATVALIAAILWLSRRFIGHLISKAAKIA